MNENAQISVTPTAPVIKRNGVAKTCVEQVFGKLSPNKGKKFWAIQSSIGDFSFPEAAEKEIAFYGADFIAATLSRVARKISSEIFLDCFDVTTGIFDSVKWQADMEDFTAGASTLDDIQAEIDELTAQFQALSEDPGLELPESGEATPEYLKLSEQMKSIGMKLKPLRAQKAAIAAKYAIVVEKRKAAKEATAKAAGVAAA